MIDFILHNLGLISSAVGIVLAYFIFRKPAQRAVKRGQDAITDRRTQVDQLIEQLGERDEARKADMQADAIRDSIDKDRIRNQTDEEALKHLEERYKGQR